MAHSPLSFLTHFLLLSLIPLTKAQTLLASLDYGSFQGSFSSTYNLTYFRKIPFAASPTGINRFRAPQPPLPITNGTYNSDQSYDFCPQRTVNGTEDCLYLGLYGRPWTKGQALRPVVVVYYGGAFIQGGGSFTLPPAGYPVLNASTDSDFIFVYPNYRVNAFGFLPGAEIASDPNSDLNPGLLDQQAALVWTNKYIEQFGGDKGNVSIWGQSAGGGSVVAQVIANGGKTNPPLFSKALASSPFWPKTYKYDAPEAQAIYDAFVELAGCKGEESLKCLKETDVQTLRTASLAISGSHTYNTSSYTWAPVIDGTFLTQPLSQATIKGDVNIDYGWGMYNTHEGENFIPPGLGGTNNSGTPPFNSSTASFDNWLRGFLPGFTDRNIARVEELYPEVGSTETISSYNTSYTRAGLIYRDIVLACPTYWTARAAHKKSYVGEYSISPAKHASDTIYYTLSEQGQQLAKIMSLYYLQYLSPAKPPRLSCQGWEIENADSLSSLQNRAFASFFQTGNPNAHKLTNSSIPGVPENWRTGEEFVVEADGFEKLKVDELGERCGFWRQVADDVPI
ncbi:probable carboxylesterase [Phialocephala subalpina]|uniref:Carboxylic ester hydrolase n=1 Tax=Phialocephala subalpina TaxID=576137 RepID=A0A1L7WDN7_9HELO|nr:probable carboxylesterase [Phialocephala subalpina]